jgi:heme oxygenase
LERDLEALSVDINPDEFSQLDTDCTGRALGLLYVCEGSCIGNQQLYTALKKHRQFVDWGSDAFLSGCKSGFAERWKATLGLLAEHCRNDVSSLQYKNMENGALAGFKLYGVYWSRLGEHTPDPAQCL